ncbi:MAG: hypothetical protein EHM61_09785 [Acidobacteria bacterium]|nr:MAG: hypothetical protein EHM61_09785 [Acidobacteriota bacterium]
MRILLSYFSFTSRVESLARQIETCLTPRHDVTLTAIRPVRDRSYWHWLLLSFIPGSSVAITSPPTDLRSFERVCLGFPKWTFSCPPVNRYLATLPALNQTARFGLFMAFGGFDEDRYLRDFAVRVSRKGRVAATLAVKRSLIEAPECASYVHRFCELLVEAPSPSAALKLDAR